MKRPPEACLEIENLEITMLQFFSVSFSKACLEIENLEMTMLQFFSVSLSNAFSRDSVSFLIGTMNMFCTKGLYQKQ